MRDTPTCDWSNGDVALGTTLKSVSPNVAEALGHTPLDAFFIDRQHGLPVEDGLENLLRAAALNDMTMIVRVPKDDLSMVTYCFDAGVDAVMLPQIEDCSLVEEAITHVQYNQGRSLATTTRAADYGYADRDKYMEHVNNEIVLLPQIESVAGIEALDDILEIQGINDIAIGPGDLAFSLGVEFGSPEHRDAIDRIFSKCERGGVNAGTFVGSTEDIKRYRERASFLIYRSDLTVLTDEFERALSEI